MWRLGAACAANVPRRLKGAPEKPVVPVTHAPTRGLMLTPSLSRLNVDANGRQINDIAVYDKGVK
jgi:hypothetical protein